MGGSGEKFTTTKWTEIFKAKTLDETRRREAINELIKKYWKPIYCYLRRKGYFSEDAKDMTQGFFFEIVLGRDLIQQADKAKGRFRTFLLTALGRYATDKYREKNTKKRLPEGKMVSLQTNDMEDLIKMQSESCPEQIFHHVWASEVLDRVLAKTKEECCHANKETYWKVFYAKVVVPIVDGVETPKLCQLCKEYGIESEAKASNMIAYVKERFRVAMKSYLRQFVQSDADVDEEFNEILKILSKNSTR